MRVDFKEQACGTISTKTINRLARAIALVAQTPLAYRSDLENLVNRYSTPQQIVLRAKIILLASEGNNNRDIGRICFPIATSATPFSINWKNGCKVTSF